MRMWQISKLEKAQGCLMGQVVGDALGSPFEFKTKERVKELFPDGVKDIEGSKLWNTLPGQPTDDSEMALALARCIVKHNRFDGKLVLEEYRKWIDSFPFSRGVTTLQALRDEPDVNSQSNGSLMRVSPIGILGCSHSVEQIGVWGAEDSMLTHPNEVCVQVCSLFVMGIGTAIQGAFTGKELYEKMCEIAKQGNFNDSVVGVLEKAATVSSEEQGYGQYDAINAFHNAVWQLVHAESFEEGVVNCVMLGGDTDTNAAICGALLGAVYGIKQVPERWVDTIRKCRPQSGRVGVQAPRPMEYWPCDVLKLAEQLSQVQTK